MLDNELLDVLSKEGKRGGGYCTGLPEYGVPFIFANFNGTQHDVEVVTHEAGHAFEAYTNINRVPLSYIWPSMDGAEVHSMSMEFFAEGWAEDFFGDDAKKFLYSHLAGALKFIPYGTLKTLYLSNNNFSFPMKEKIKSYAKTVKGSGAVKIFI